MASRARAVPASAQIERSHQLLLYNVDLHARRHVNGDRDDGRFTWARRWFKWRRDRLELIPLNLRQDKLGTGEPAPMIKKPVSLGREILMQLRPRAKRAARKVNRRDYLL